MKPENIVIDDSGYFYITDFGIAKFWRSNNSDNTSGTPGYMAPEVLARQKHSYEVDFYALGIILFEIMVGRRPYQGKNRKEIRDNIFAK